MNNATTVITWVIIALIIIGGGYWLFARQGASSMVPPAATTTQNAGNATNPPAARAAVSIQNFKFSPASLTVAPGTTVTWTNNDAVAHTVTADNGSFDSKVIAPGQSFSYTFAAPGSVSYHCAIHPMMKGTVMVQ